MAQPSAGWYPDQSDPSRQRYFDGKAWTERYAPVSASTSRDGRPATAKKSDTKWRIGFALAVVAAVGITLADVIRGEDPPPPDEDAYVDTLFTSKFDVLLPKRAFIQQGYESCELLQAGFSEQDTALIMRDRDEYKGHPEEQLKRYQEQTVAARAHLCPDA